MTDIVERKKPRNIQAGPCDDLIQENEQLSQQLAECQSEVTQSQGKLRERIRDLEDSLANAVNADWHNEAIKQAKREGGHEALLEAATILKIERAFNCAEWLTRKAKELE
jgi:hypothetical protein